MELEVLASLLGLADTATEEQVKEAIVGLKSGPPPSPPPEGGGAEPRAGDDAQQDASDDEQSAPPPEGLPAPPMARQAGGGDEPPASDSLPPSGGDRGGDSEVDDLQKQVAALSNKLAQRDADDAVDQAIAACKITPAQRDWAVGYAMRDPDGFGNFVECSPQIIANKATAPPQSPKEPSEADLSDEDRHVCKLFGTDPKEFAAAKAELVASA